MFSFPNEILNIIFSHLIKRPQLEILYQEATKEQQAEVLALNKYHLIIESDEDNIPVKYFLGFRKKEAFGGKVEYVEELLDKKSSFYRIVTEDPDFITQKNFVLHYLEQAIHSMGGAVRHYFYDTAQFILTCKMARQCMQLPAVKQELLKRFLWHVAFGEQDEAEAILKIYPEFLLSDYKRDVISCTEEMVFHNTTGFQLALRGDWYMWKMMLKVLQQSISEDDQKKYIEDLLAQKQEVDDQKLWHTIDNLSLCGLQVLETNLNEPTREQMQIVKERNAYHLILTRDEEQNIIDVELGFYKKNEMDDQYSYVRHKLCNTNDLKIFICNPQNKQIFRRKKDNYFNGPLRQKTVLDLTKVAINKVGGETEFQDNKTSDMYIKHYEEKHSNLCVEKHHGLWLQAMDRRLRLCFSNPNFVQSWMGDNFPSEKRPTKTKIFPLFTFTSLLSDCDIGNYYLYGGGGNCRYCNYHETNDFYEVMIRRDRSFCKRFSSINTKEKELLVLKFEQHFDGAGLESLPTPSSV